MADSEYHKFLDPKVLNTITRLDLRARLVVEGYITGLHKSPYHGFAVEFLQHRQYVPGDEIKHIDWKVWSRTDRYYIKEYEEDTNLRCTLLVDCSRSMRYGHPRKAVPGSRGSVGGGTSGGSKFDYAATLAASLAYLLVHQQDAAGLVTFDNDVRVNLPASSHPTQIKQILYELENTEPDNRTDIADVFPMLAEQINRRGIVVLISDLFVDLDSLTEAMRQFRYRRHEVVVFHVMHEDELNFPFSDNTLFKDLEYQREVLAEPGALRSSYIQAKDKFINRVRRCCSKAGVDYVLLSTADRLDAALSSYLSFRQRTIRTLRRH